MIGDDSGGGRMHARRATAHEHAHHTGGAGGASKHSLTAAHGWLPVIALLGASGSSGHECPAQVQQRPVGRGAAPWSGRTTVPCPALPIRKLARAAREGSDLI